MRRKVVAERRAPKSADFDAFPSAISINASADAVHVGVNARRLFNLFAAHFNRILATSPRHPNYEPDLAAQMRKGVSRADAIARTTARHVTAVRVFAFEALTRFMTDTAVLEEAFKAAFETAMAKTRVELQKVAVVDDHYATVFADFTGTQIRSNLLKRGLVHTRRGWEAPSGGDRRSKVSAEDAPILLERVARYRDLWAEIKKFSSGLTSSAALEAAANIAAKHNLSARERKFVGPLAKLLVSRRVQSADKKPQALAALHAALALDLESPDVLGDSERLKVLPSRWNRRYDRLKKARPSDDNQEFS
jgi:hypothetical protein